MRCKSLRKSPLASPSTYLYSKWQPQFCQASPRMASFCSYNETCNAANQRLLKHLHGSLNLSSVHLTSISCSIQPSVPLTAKLSSPSMRSIGRTWPSIGWTYSRWSRSSRSNSTCSKSLKERPKIISRCPTSLPLIDQCILCLASWPRSNSPLLARKLVKLKSNNSKKLMRSLPNKMRMGKQLTKKSVRL